MVEIRHDSRSADPHPDITPGQAGDGPRDRHHQPDPRITGDIDPEGVEARRVVPGLRGARVRRRAEDTHDQRQNSGAAYPAPRGSRCQRDNSAPEVNGHSSGPHLRAGVRRRGRMAKLARYRPNISRKYSPKSPPAESSSTLAPSQNRLVCGSSAAAMNDARLAKPPE